jgi:hypothetical protein
MGPFRWNRGASGSVVVRWFQDSIGLLALIRTRHAGWDPFAWNRLVALRTMSGLLGIVCAVPNIGQDSATPSPRSAGAYSRAAKPHARTEHAQVHGPEASAQPAFGGLGSGRPGALVSSDRAHRSAPGQGALRVGQCDGHEYFPIRRSFRCSMCWRTAPRPRSRWSGTRVSSVSQQRDPRRGPRAPVPRDPGEVRSDVPSRRSVSQACTRSDSICHGRVPVMSSRQAAPIRAAVLSDGTERSTLAEASTQTGQPAQASFPTLVGCWSAAHPRTALGRRFRVFECR